MKVLFLAPQPFFIERGTPIAVRLALEVLSKRQNEKIDLLSYHEGKTIDIDRVNHIRMKAPKWLNNIGPGISFKKLLCDVFFIIALFKLLIRNRKQQYDLLHAVEESVFMAWVVKIVFGIAYVYDMDSSIPQQITEKWKILKPIQFVMNACEKLAVTGSLAVVPVCDALAVIAKRYGSSDTQILRDVPLSSKTSEKVAVDLRKELELDENQKICLYVGNLESYQGIDLLVDAFALIAENNPNSILVIVGGNEAHQTKYKKIVKELDLESQILIAGRRPIGLLANYLSQADILVSPRTKGNNTPMKIYSYLHSGIPTVATRLMTHTQVMSDEISYLADPTPQDFAKGLDTLINNPKKAKELGLAAREHAEKNYTFEVFQRDLNSLYDRISHKLTTSKPTADLQLT